MECFLALDGTMGRIHTTMSMLDKNVTFPKNSNILLIFNQYEELNSHYTDMNVPSKDAYNNGTLF